MDWFPWENLQEPHRFSHEIWVVNLVSSTHLGMATIPPLEMVIWRMVYDIVYLLRSHYSCESCESVFPSQFGFPKLINMEILIFMFWAVCIWGYQSTKEYPYPRRSLGESEAGAVRRRLHRQAAEVSGPSEPGPILTPLGFTGIVRPSDSVGQTMTV